MIKVEVLLAEFEHRKSQPGAPKQYDFATQEAFLHKGGTYPDRMQVPLQKDGKGNYVPYPPGWYTFTDASFQVRDGRPGIDAFNLQLVGTDAPVGLKK